MIYNLWKKDAISDEIDSKRSVSRCLQGHNLLHQRKGLRARFELYRFFTSIHFFLISKGVNLHKGYAIKNIGHRARSRAKDRRTSLPVVHLLENNTVF